MTEITDFIGAIVAIAKDPKAWEKRLGDADDIAKQLAEARKTKKEADEAASQAAKDLETARYERGQAEHARRAAEQQASVNAARSRELDAREKELGNQRASHERSAASANADFARREADLDAREKIAAKKLNDAQKLLASYDEAKHKAALKLAS